MKCEQMCYLWKWNIIMSVTWFFVISVSNYFNIIAGYGIALGVVCIEILFEILFVKHDLFGNLLLGVGIPMVFTCVCVYVNSISMYPAVNGSEFLGLVFGVLVVTIISVFIVTEIMASYKKKAEPFPLLFLVAFPFAGIVLGAPFVFVLRKREQMMNRQ